MQCTHRSVATRGWGLLALCCMLLPASLAWSQASWVGDVIVDGEPSNLWADCLPCTDISEPPNTNWSTDRIPGDDGPLGDPGTGAVIGPNFVVDHNGGTLDLSTLDVQGGLIVGGLINISDSATINNITLESGGALAGPGPVTLTGSGTWNGALRAGGGVTNQATLTAETGDLQTDLVNSATLIVNPSLDFTSTPSTLTNNGNIFLNTDTALNNNSNILDGTDGVNLLLNHGTIAKSGVDLSVIEAPGNHAGGLINASDGTLRFFRNDWQFSGGSMSVSNGGQMELTGNVDHLINGTSGISGQGSLLVNMNTFGTLTVAQPFVIDLTGSGEHGLLLQGIGIDLEDALTNRQGGRWSQGTISGAGAGRLVNESPLNDPFRIVSGGSKRLSRNLDSPGWIEQSSSVRVDAPHRLLIETAGGLAILADPAGIDWTGNGEIVNSGRVEIQAQARSTISAVFSQTGGSLTSAGELTLRGGGMWSGTTFTELAGQHPDPAVPAISMENSRFDFVSGTHVFNDIDAALDAEILQVTQADLFAAPAATVIFSLDEGGILNESAPLGGRVVLSTGSTLDGMGRFENRGGFLWQGGQFGSTTEIQFVNAAGAQLSIPNSGNLLSGHLSNRGTVLGGLLMFNGSTIDNHEDGAWLLGNGDSIGVTDPTNRGVFNNAGSVSAFSSDAASEMRIEARLGNMGKVGVGQGVLRITGPVDQLQNGVLSGGEWFVGQGGTLVFPQPFDTIGPGTHIFGLERIEGAGILVRIDGGSAIVTGDFLTTGNVETLGNGQLRLGGGSTVLIPGGMRNGDAGAHTPLVEMLDEALVINAAPRPPEQRVTADSGNSKQASTAAFTGTPLLTTPLFDNYAILAPGGIGLPGPFNLDGELVMHPGSTLDIDLAGATPVAGHDQLAVSGPIALAGTLQISVAEGFFPAVGQPFVIATAGQGTTGMIDEVVNVNREDIVWSITETADEVIVEAIEVERIFESDFES